MKNFEILKVSSIKEVPKEFFRSNSIFPQGSSTMLPAGKVIELVVKDIEPILLFTKDGVKRKLQYLCKDANGVIHRVNAQQFYDMKTALSSESRGQGKAEIEIGSKITAVSRPYNMEGRSGQYLVVLTQVENPVEKPEEEEEEIF